MGRSSSTDRLALQSALYAVARGKTHALDGWDLRRHEVVDRLAVAAIKERVAPALRAALGEHVPEGRIGYDLLENAAHAEAILRLQEVVLDTIEDQQVVPTHALLLLKGSAVADFYPRQLIRYRNDCDLAVLDPASYWRLATWFTSIGYRVLPIGTARRDRGGRWHFTFAFRRDFGASGFKLQFELHSAEFSINRRRSVALAPIAQRSRDVGRNAIRRPAAADCLLLLLAEIAGRELYVRDAVDLHWLVRAMGSAMPAALDLVGAAGLLTQLERLQRFVGVLTDAEAPLTESRRPPSRNAIWVSDGARWPGCSVALERGGWPAVAAEALFNATMHVATAPACNDAWEGLVRSIVRGNMAGSLRLVRIDRVRADDVDWVIGRRRTWCQSPIGTFVAAIGSEPSLNQLRSAISEIRAERAHVG